MVMKGFSTGVCMEILNWLSCWPSSNETFSRTFVGDRDVGSKATYPVVNYEELCRKVGTSVHKALA